MALASDSNPPHSSLDVPLQGHGQYPDTGDALIQVLGGLTEVWFGFGFGVEGLCLPTIIWKP